MAILTVPVIVRVDGSATGTGSTPLDTDPSIESPPEIMTWPFSLRIFYESYAAGDVYPMSVVISLDEGDDLVDALAAAVVTARTAYVAAGHAFP